jgi:hypothetical protein
MFQRAFYLLHGTLDLDALFRLSEHEFVVELERAAGTGPAGDLLHGLFGPTRQLYKRLAQFGFSEGKELYQLLARRPYPWLAACCEHFAIIASTALGRVVAPHEVLFDAPPVSREVQISIEIQSPKEGTWRELADVSPVVRALATEQFDDYVKRVRIYAHPRLVADLRRLPNLPQLLDQAVERTG